MAKFKDLIPDIYTYLENQDKEFSEDNLSQFLENLGDIFRDALGRRSRSNKEKKLVASNFGLPPRRLWYTIKSTEGDKKLSGSDRIRFLYGNILEELVLFLAKETGHSVTEEQARVEVDGVPGKKDARIDGVVVEIKSASGFSYKKFANGSFLLNEDDSDPFGYKYQLGLYMQQDNDDKGGFVVINKENGELCSLLLDTQYDIPDINLKIENARISLEHEEPPPEKCYAPKSLGKSGNMILNKLCTYCDFKELCWKDCNEGKGLIENQYAHDKVWFTKLVKEPRKWMNYQQLQQ